MTSRKKALFFVRKHLSKLYGSDLTIWLKKVELELASGKKVICYNTKKAEAGYSSITGVCIVDIEQNKICTLVVDPLYRGQGIGTKMLCEMIKNHKISDNAFITVHKDAISSMREFLTNRGFEVTGESDKELIFTLTKGCHKVLIKGGLIDLWNLK